MPMVAVLNEQGRLIGRLEKAKPAKNDVLCGDLPADGSYKWMEREGCFLPVGSGFGPLSSAPPIDNTRALYLLAQCLSDAPQELREWMAWYEANLKKRDEELQEKRIKRKGRR